MRGDNQPQIGQCVNQWTHALCVVHTLTGCRSRPKQLATSR